MAGRAHHRGFGHVRKLPSGRHQASYVGPDLTRYTAPATFHARQDAEAWLMREHGLIAAGGWTSPVVRARPKRAPMTFAGYAAAWLAGRDLKPRTRAHYAALLDRRILPTFGPLAVESIAPADVRAWWTALGGKHPTIRAHAYSLLRGILVTAVADDLIPANPCRIRGAGQAKRASRTEPASLEQLAALVDAMPERYRVMTLLAAWCGLRFGELVELRVRDVDTRDGVIHIRRAVVRAGVETIVSTPKSGAGIRDVAIPPHLVPAVRAHVQPLTFAGRDALLFPAAGDPTRHLRPATLYGAFYPAREAAGRPDLRWHDLRHTGAVLAAATGATLAELMARLGHSTAGAAMRYQHAAAGRDQQIAAALSELAGRVI